MKTTPFLFSVALAAAMMSCGGGQQNETETAAEPAAEGTGKTSWTVDTETSNVRWEGGTAGAMVYSHFGSINIKSGALTSENNTITGGNFVIDMTTISPEDNGYSEENPKEKLVGHLSSPDFFLVEQFPTATFNATSMEGSTLKGDLTVRGITHPGEVKIESMEVAPDGNTMKATGKLTFDRQKYDVKWAHFMQDVVLSDDIKLDITLVAKKS